MPSASKCARDRSARARGGGSCRSGPTGPVRQQHVVEHGEIVDQRHFLKRGLHAARLRVARRGEARRPRRTAGTPPASGCDEAREQLDDRRFAGAVLAEQRMHRAARDRETRRRRPRPSRRRPCARARPRPPRTVWSSSRFNSDIADPCGMRRRDSRRPSSASARLIVQGSGWPTSAACRPISGVSAE